MRPETGKMLKGIMKTSMAETARALDEFSSRESESFISAVELIANAMRGGFKLLLCGNGGSAADCQHLAAEFVCRLRPQMERKALPALALTTDTSFLTAFVNDYCFEDVFARQVEAFGKPGDVLMGISTSGGSENIKRALARARELGLGTVALTRRGGAIGLLCDVSLEVDSTDTAVIQNTHLAIEHALCAAVEEVLFCVAADGGANP
ncbi:MAG: D-sedoheptulose 7-phosphate isomerase [Synergistales bacterium]|nr:D-sedoheptulose 7-phosphate isomerase [Synergistales bacterium]